MKINIEKWYEKNYEKITCFIVGALFSSSINFFYHQEFVKFSLGLLLIVLNLWQYQKHERNLL
jgi:arginyl-tRNA--protein-N-Asp/Glu arginylyltransferase